MGGGGTKKDRKKKGSDQVPQKNEGCEVLNFEKKNFAVKFSVCIFMYFACLHRRGAHRAPAFFALCKSTDGRRCNIKIVYSEKCLLLFVYPISFAQKQRICPVKGFKFFASLSYKKAGGGRVTVPIRARSNAQKTHIYGVKAAYNMSYII